MDLRLEVKDWLRELEPPVLAESSWRKYERVVVRSYFPYLESAAEGFGPRAVCTANAREYAKWLVRERHVSRNTVHDYLTVLGIFAEWLRQKHRKLYPKPPLAGLEKPKLTVTDPVPLTYEQFRALLYEAEHSREPLRGVAMLWLFMETGIRCDELCGLRLEDLNRTFAKKQGMAIIRGKGDKRRDVYYSADAWEAVERYLRAKPSAHGRPRSEKPWVFLNNYGAKMLDGSVRTWFHRLAARAGLSIRLHPHLFRHTVPVLMLKNGADVFTVKKMLGHGSLSTTERYVHIAKADLADSQYANGVSAHWGRGGLRRRRRDDD